MRNMLLPLLPAVAMLLLLSGCGGKALAPDAGPPPDPDMAFQAPVSRQPENAPPARDPLPAPIDDPWEGFNRSMYTFNAQFDRVVFLPILRVYKAVLPDKAEQSVSNFFNNLGELPTMANCLLQGKLQGFFTTLDRVVINSTIGLLGVFDVAGELGAPRYEEDFGQTLGAWGVGSGPYLVLPLLGPSSVRDAAGAAGDYALTAWEFDVLQTKAGLSYPERLGVTGVNAVDTRNQQTFRYYESGSPFEYLLIRYLYATKRELDVKK